jgi:hypothetical protein
MRQLFTASLLLLLLCLARPALGQLDMALQVTREPGAEACPDGPSLGARVAAIRGPASAPSGQSYTVVFTRDSSGYSAAVGATERPLEVRTIGAPGETCEAIAQAAALAIVLLVDGEVAAPEPAAPEPAPPVSPAQPARAARAVTPPGKHADQNRRKVRGSLSASGGLLAGVLEPVSPLVASELALVAARFRVGLGALWVPRQTVRLGPGALHETLLAGSLRGCAALWRWQALRFEGCGGLHAGAVHVRARGFTRNEQRTRALVSLPLELALLYVTGLFGVELSTAALVPLRRHDFSIDALGSAHDSWPVALSARLHALVLWP